LAEALRRPARVRMYDIRRRSAVTPNGQLQTHERLEPPPHSHGSITVYFSKSRTRRPLGGEPEDYN
jgi:hypothetical protein